MARSLCSKKITCKGRKGPSYCCLRLILATQVALKIIVFKLLFSSFPFFSQTFTVLSKNIWCMSCQIRIFFTSYKKSHRLIFGETIYAVTKKEKKFKNHVACSQQCSSPLAHTITVESMQRQKSRTAPTWHGISQHKHIIHSTESKQVMFQGVWTWNTSSVSRFIQIAPSPKNLSHVTGNHEQHLHCVALKP